MKYERKNIRLTLSSNKDKKIIEILENTTDTQLFIKESIFNYYIDIKNGDKESMYFDDIYEDKEVSMNATSTRIYNYYDERQKYSNEKEIVDNSDIVSLDSEDEFDETYDCKDLEI